MTSSSEDRAMAPRVRRDGPGGLKVAQADGKGTPWWRLVGDNGEILGHSQVYASIWNAARGADTAERTVIENAHRSGEALYDVLREMDRQDAKWGDQTHHPDGTGPATFPLGDLSLTWEQQPDAAWLAVDATEATERAAEDRTLTWRHILLEEVCEALAKEPNSPALAAELHQIAAVATQWAAAVHRRYVHELTEAVLTEAGVVGVFDERACQKCGCTDNDACTNDGDACYWVAADLCSACLPDDDEEAPAATIGAVPTSAAEQPSPAEARLIELAGDPVDAGPEDGA